MFVKVCGLKSTEQIDQAIALGYDAIGIVLCKKSKRYVTPEDAIKLARYAKGKIKTFVVSITFEEAKDAYSEFDYVQIYEHKELPNLVFASGNMPDDGITYNYFVYDASKGSGDFETFPDWLKEMRKKTIIAGGLTSLNVRAVVREFVPFGVDVSSGVETNGVKDFNKMKQFIKEVRDEAQ